MPLPYGLAAHGKQVRHEGEPITLSAGLTIQPNDHSEPQTDALKNPTADIISIYEIKWTLSMPLADHVSGIVLTGAAVNVGLTYRDLRLTNVPIPLLFMGRSEHALPENSPAFFGPNGYYSGTASGLLRLDRPIYLGPNEAIVPTFSHRGLFPLPITVQFGVSGKIIKAAPQKRWLPFMASWTSKQLNTSNAYVLTDSSSERDLINSTKGPIEVARFTGRIDHYMQSTGAGIYAIESPNYVAQPFPWLGGQDLKLQMRDSRGYSTVRVPTPFRTVFPAPTRSWECPHVLPEGTYYIADVAMSVPDPETPSNQQIHVGIGMIGYQEVTP